MTIIVLASAARISGAKTIYLQFVKYLPQFIGDDKYFIFVDPTVPQPSIQGVTYINVYDHSWFNRLYWDFIGFKKWTKTNQIIPDVVVSLQNTSVICDCRQIIYYHQALPFYSNKWNPFKKTERGLFLYKYIYPWFVKATIRRDAQIVVQIPFMKKGFINVYRHNPQNIHVLFPDIDVSTSKIDSPPCELNNYFIYPATGAKYKNHRTIINAIENIKSQNTQLADCIKVVLTLDKNKDCDIYKYIQQKGCESNFVFIGQVSYDILMKFISGSNALLFPSTVESLGLPLIEAATFGKAIIAADMEYSKEVLSSYSGVTYLPHDNYNLWAKRIIKLHLNKEQFSPIEQKRSTWSDFFKLIKTQN